MRARRQSLLDRMQFAEEVAQLRAEEEGVDVDDDEDDDDDASIDLLGRDSPDGDDIMEDEDDDEDDLDDDDDIEDDDDDALQSQLDGWSSAPDSLADSEVMLRRASKSSIPDISLMEYEPMDDVDLSRNKSDGGGLASQRSRRTSFVDRSVASASSAPARNGSAELAGRSSSIHGSRRVTVSIPSEKEIGGPGGIKLRKSSRRGNVSFVMNDNTDCVSESRKGESNLIKRSILFLRRSTNTRRQGDDCHVHGDGIGDLTLDQLGHQDANSVAAAAAVVAAGAAPNQVKRGHVQFKVGDPVLVLIKLLNITNKDDPDELFSVRPVNRFGFPNGEGRTDEEKQGPHVFILATIKTVHFDEDVPYYTVLRADTNTEQRSDAGWMEPLLDAEGVLAAQNAATRTTRALAENDISEEPEAGVLGDVENFVMTVLLWPAKFVRTRLLPFYRNCRAQAKLQVTRLLHGDTPFACRMRVTGINLLVLCSFVYLFLDVMNLAFFPAGWDFEVAIIGLVVWCILLMELIFEMLIRPANYAELVESDKAFAPSTARHINRYHLVTESIALLLFLPNFSCIHTRECGHRVLFGGIDSSLDAVVGDSRGNAALGRFALGLTAFRIVGLVRHWKQMWIGNTYKKDEARPRSMVHQILLTNTDHTESERDLLVSKSSKHTKKEKKDDDEDGTYDNSTHHGATPQPGKGSAEEDQRLKKAATIGTALMVVNSHRALFLIISISTVLPVLYSLIGQNAVAERLVEILEQNNLAVLGNSTDECAYLRNAVFAWIRAAEALQRSSPLAVTPNYILWAQISPERCDFENGVITTCTEFFRNQFEVCRVWHDTRDAPEDNLRQFFADKLDIRVGGITQFNRASIVQGETFGVTVVFNENDTVQFTNFTLFLLLVGILLLGLVGLTVLRNDAGRLVLDPLQRMLKIVVRYAENPLSQTPTGVGQSRKSKKSVADSDLSTGPDQHGNGKEQLGNFETEQLINAITKIADLLRKCWGVAGAGIISSNLARTKDGGTVVFNPTVPGKRVYALFGFVAINGFDKHLRALDRDVMILINDVAKVVHDEVYRWALGDSGQCNKNLGAAFLMVFRIGDFSEVEANQEAAVNIVFKDTQATKRNAKREKQRRNANHRGRRGALNFGKRRSIGVNAEGNRTLQLASLPGIQSFTDRALLGMLKSFAGIHRDRNLINWKKDFRLGAGVGAFTVDVIYGMDAGWAVEGAVGSEYKIDATYLSPHVNMASRMMSATKQYGVTILLSQAVEELLSKPARSKLRHLDTVTVKGSSLPQRIFTFDARHEGVDFFLIERSPEQADSDAEAYNTSIWDTDQDLKAMRQHVTDDFMESFKKGVDQYLDGNWKEAISNLQAAEDLMIEAVLEEGYIDFDTDDIQQEIFDRRSTNEEITRIRSEFGDGACRCLLNYMERRNGVPPKDWKGVRKLLSK